jgi:O-antigen/teichoic acid export membrane protein
MMRGEHENGIYAVAPRLTEILYFIPISIINAAAPALLRSHARDPREYDRRLTRVFIALTWIAIAIALPTSLLSPWIIGLLFPHYLESAPVLAIHIWSAPAFFMGVGITNWFIAEGRQIDLFVRSLVSVLVNVLLNLWLIPAMGARGAALATLISQVAAYWLANALFPSTRHLFRLQCRSLLPFAPSSERRE